VSLVREPGEADLVLTLKPYTVERTSGCVRPRRQYADLRAEEQYWWADADGAGGMYNLEPPTPVVPSRATRTS